MKLFDLDGPFQKYGSMLFDIIVLSILWLIPFVFSATLLTGPLNCGLNAGAYAGVVTQEGYTFRQFYHKFKKGFLRKLAVGILGNVVIFICLFNIYMVVIHRFGSDLLLPVYLFIFIEVGFILSYLYPLLAFSQLTLKEAIKTAFVLSNKHMPTSFLATIINGALVGLLVVISLGYFRLMPILFIAPGVVTATNSYLISKRILSRYDFFEIEHIH